MPAALFPFMRIVVDVMGGDHGISVVINGVKQALQAYPHISELHLVGLKPDEVQLRDVPSAPIPGCVCIMPPR